MHIPLPELVSGWNRGSIVQGQKGEWICCPSCNTQAMLALECETMLSFMLLLCMDTYMPKVLLTRMPGSQLDALLCVLHASSSLCRRSDCPSPSGYWHADHWALKRCMWATTMTTTLSPSSSGPLPTCA